MKKLKEMTLEELWHLFPIILTEHKEYWKQWYDDEVKIIQSILPCDINIYHIGSTAIKGILAKPIIDILISVNDINKIKHYAEVLEKNGYIIMSYKDTCVSLNKGYLESGFAKKVFHLHIKPASDTDEIYFRDYLNKHIDIAKEYEKLKLKLAKKFKYNRDAYTNAKSDFINKYTKIAKEEKLL